MDPGLAIEVAAMTQHRSLQETILKGDSEIQKFYSNCIIFITGGTGFIGKQLIEKLFRACNVSKIYVLTRSKKGKLLKERIHEMLQDPVFETIRKQQPQFESKLVPLSGDVADFRLGLSDKDWKTIVDEVNVVFHMAATTRFDETLRLATMINVRGTREAMLLAKDCKKLKSFVHVSTAYTQALTSLIDQEVYEEFRPSPIPPETLISMAEEMDEARFNGITTNLIADWPNTYTFTKAVAEDIVRRMSVDLPMCIVRPGIVTSAYREPTPGWLDMSCAYGASGILLGLALGLLHVMIQNKSTKLGVVPCDYVNNTIIAAAREASRGTGGDSTKIYVVSSTKQNPMLQGVFRDVLNTHRKQLPTPKAIYYNYALETSNQKMFIFLSWFLHFIPAYFVDFVCLLLGQQRRLVKIYTKVYRMTTALSYFTMSTWTFNDKNTENLYKGMSKTDKVIFNFDISSINWKEYILIWCIGIRKYIIKDGLKDTDKANKKQAWFRMLHYTLTVLYIYCIWKVLYLTFFVLRNVFSIFTLFSCEKV